MLSLVPKIHDLVGSSASRTVAQLHEWGIEPGDRRVTISVVVDPLVSPGRRLLARALIDMLLRLDPLVGAVIIDAPGMNEEAIGRELALKLPVEIGPADIGADYSIGVGAGPGTFDLTVDGAGWLAAIGNVVDVEDDGNPIGPLTGAALATGEAFKWAFGTMYPDITSVREFVPWTGAFSFFSYSEDAVSPPISNVNIDTTLIGVGGVGAGFLRAIATLGEQVSGALVMVDNDILTVDSLNRVSYATLAGVKAGKSKVIEAEAALRHACPNLDVSGRRMTFDTYKRLTPRREDRRYDIIVTGLDDDAIRRDVQRDLPRVLIDGSTGRDMVARVERVEFGRYGCLGCSRPPMPDASDGAEHCDDPPDVRAPSLSFLSSFPGILAAGEVIKESMGFGSLRGRFDHVFRYGPNPDLVGMPGFSDDCLVGCRRPSKIDQYQRKNPGEIQP